MKEKKEHIAKLVSILAKTFGVQTSKPLYYAYEIAMLDEEIDFKKLLSTALKNCERMPTPKKLLELADEKPKLNSKQAGIELLEKLKAGIRKYGYSNPEIARHDLDPKVWELAGRFGGWVRACQTDFSNPSVNAQARDICEVIALTYVPNDKAQGPSLDSKASKKTEISNDTRPTLKELQTMIKKELGGNYI